jgi:hypothetical protein
MSKILIVITSSQTCRSSIQGYLTSARPRKEFMALAGQGAVRAVNKLRLCEILCDEWYDCRGVSSFQHFLAIANNEVPISTPVSQRTETCLAVYNAYVYIPHQSME